VCSPAPASVAACPAATHPPPPAPAPSPPPAAPAPVAPSPPPAAPASALQFMLRSHAQELSAVRKRGSTKGWLTSETETRRVFVLSRRRRRVKDPRRGGVGEPRQNPSQSESKRKTKRGEG
jgi:hypothetical protein